MLNIFDEPQSSPRASASTIDLFSHQNLTVPFSSFHAFHSLFIVDFVNFITAHFYKNNFSYFSLPLSREGNKNTNIKTKKK